MTSRKLSGTMIELAVLLAGMRRILPPKRTGELTPLFYEANSPGTIFRVTPAIQCVGTGFEIARQNAGFRTWARFAGKLNSRTCLRTLFPATSWPGRGH